MVNKLLELSEHPFEEESVISDEKGNDFWRVVPDWAHDICISCSS